MYPHPDYADVALPREISLGAVHLTPLSPAYVDEDYAAVMASADLLSDVFGDWPQGLTREANLIDLSWHEREFTARRSFSWILRNGAGVYIGCFYLYPELGALGRTEATMWLCDIPHREERAREIKTCLAAWLGEVLPPEIALGWVTSPAL